MKASPRTGSTSEEHSRVGASTRGAGAVNLMVSIRGQGKIERTINTDAERSSTRRHTHPLTRAERGTPVYFILAVQVAEGLVEGVKGRAKDKYKG